MNEILLHIYNSKGIKDAAKRIAGGLSDDLMQELLIMISEANQEIITKLYKENKLVEYCCKMMYYQYTNPSNSFYKKYRSSYELKQEQREEDKDDTDTYKVVTEIINKLEGQISKKRYPSEIRLLYLYSELGNYRAVGNEVGIHFTTVQYMVKNIIEKIKKEYDSTNNR